MSVNVVRRSKTAIAVIGLAVLLAVAALGASAMSRHAAGQAGASALPWYAKPLDKGVLLLLRSEQGSRFVVIRVES